VTWGNVIDSGLSQKKDVVGQCRDVVGIMGDQQRGGPFLAGEGGQQVAELVAGGPVKGAERLVEQQEARLAGGADGPGGRQKIAVGGYTTAAVLGAATAGAAAVWQVGLLRAAAWTPAACASRPVTRCSQTSSRPRRTGGRPGSSG
jgi:hypothetical protein